MCKFIATRMRLLALISGSSLVAIWTVVRHITNGVNFDVVGQIGAADQWAHAMHDGTQLGATNYLLKMPVYYVVNHIGFLSPHGKLLALALLFNIATFLLLVILFEKLLRLYSLTPNKWFYLAVVWLASISDRVYWLDYANSRNLETVGGIWVFYLGLKLIKKVTPLRSLAVVAIGGTVFFADQLQLYVIGGGLILYAIVLYVTHRTTKQLRISGLLGGSIVGAYLISKLIAIVVVKLLPVSFLVAPTQAGALSPHNFGSIIIGILGSTARVFDSSFYSASSAPSVLQELLNIGILLGVLFVVVYMWRRSKKHDLALASVCCIITAYGAYIAGGQAAHALTERYILMVPLLLILSFASLTPSFKPRTPHLAVVWLMALALSSILTIGALVVKWPERYSKDVYITNTLTFLHQHNFSYAVSSRIGITITYFSEHTAVVVPTICLPNHRLVESNLFFDKAAFGLLQKQTTPIPVIVPGGGIESSGSLCSLQDIQAQFGQPLEQLSVPGVGTAEMYSVKSLKL